MTSAPPDICETCGEPLTGSQLAGGHCSRCLFKTTFGADDIPSPAEDEMPWTQLSGCELYEEIGRGGMGVVYRARQRALDRIVAVKVLLRAQFAGDEERQRFQREAQAAARLRHPGIVGIFDVGEDDGVPWFSMDYIPGKSLEQLVREHPMDAHEAARCVKKVAEALQHAHEHGVLHRDLKPSNILLDANKSPRITDFGIAHIATGGTSSARLTRTGQALGSPGYAAPEQALSGSAEVRTDVYGLGSLLYHLLTGRPPFQGPTLDAILVQLRENDPLSPRKLNPSVPADLETICLKCLHKQPEGRYGSATAVAEELSRFLEGKAILARPIGPLGKAWRWMRRHPAMAAMLTIIVLLIGSIIGGSLAFAQHQARLEHRSSLLSEARALRQTRVAGNCTDALERLREAWEIAPSAEIRTEAIACLALPEIRMPRQKEVSIPNLSRSADGRFVAVFENGDIVVREAASSREAARLPNQKSGLLMKLDDHGTRIAIAEPKSKSLKLISVADHAVLAVCEHPLHLHSLDWSGDLIATGCDNRFIYIWDDRGKLKHRLSGHESPMIQVAFRPRGQELASTAADAHVRLWHAARGVEIVRREARHLKHRALWWSEDGATLCGVSEEGETEVFAVEHSPCLQLLAPPQEEPHSENLGSADFSPDGRLAAVMDEESARVWDFTNGRLIHRMPKQAGQWLSTLFSADGRQLWTCGWAKELTMQEVQRDASDELRIGPSKKMMPGAGSLLREASADGRWMVMSNNGIGQFIVKATTGDTSLRIKHPGTLATAISADGSWLITSSYQTPGASVWSLPDGKLMRTLCEKDTVMQATLLGRDRIILKTSGQNRVFRTQDWTEERTLPLKLRLHSMTTSLDGRWLATLGDNDVRLLETQNFTEVLRLTLPAHVGWLGECHLVFDAEARHLLVHTALGSVARWDLQALGESLKESGMQVHEGD
ncbi:MAG: serine/threonine-protein kinase [Verrucomicrobiota bacterium]